MSSKEQNGYGGTGHLPAPAQFAGPDQAPGTAISGDKRIRTSAISFKRGLQKILS
jgi:hypothetical protein